MPADPGLPQHCEPLLDVERMAGQHDLEFDLVVQRRALEQPLQVVVDQPVAESRIDVRRQE